MCFIYFSIATYNRIGYIKLALHDDRIHYCINNNYIEVRGTKAMYVRFI